MRTNVWAWHRFIDAIAAGTRVFEVRGDGQIAIHGGGLVVSGGAQIVDSGCTVSDGGLAVSVTTDIGAVDIHASNASYTSTVMLVRAERAANSAFYLQKLTSAGTDMFTVRVFALPHRIRGM